jgi:threonine/homoserine/homoserine lactone efflux protein
MTTSLGIFLLSVVGISLSGVMAPGPMTATTIAKGYHNPHAGFLVAVGHAVVEIPIMILIYFGLADFIKSPDIKKIIGVLGGLVLIYMGASIIKDMKKDLDQMSTTKYGPFVAGIVMSGGNPYFLLWWATIGLTLVLTAKDIGIFAFVLLIVVHWSCDAVWQEILSVTVHKTKHLWTKTVRYVIFGICSAVLIGFGIYYCISVFLG